MTYQETLHYLFSQLPMYQRIGAAAYKVDLNNTHQLCELLDHPERNFKSIHVAGTNGKGSTSHMLASVLQEAGYSVGLYTSPHLKDFRERVKINGAMISEEEVMHFVANHKTDFENINLSFFEWTVGLAFTYFLNQKVDIAIIETGLGGRLDSTNVVIPEVSVITNIGLDHTQFLGDTLEKIAGEKAGIIKNKVPVVIGETQDETEAVFISKAKEMNAPFYFADQLIRSNLQTDLLGGYQKKNIKTVLQTITLLKQKGWEIKDKDIEIGLLNVVNNTGLLGRWQVLGNEPLIICDTGHNEAGIFEITQQLAAMDYQSLHVVFGAVNDKSIDTILQLLPVDARYYLCEAAIPRALPIHELAAKFTDCHLVFETHVSVKSALEAAKQRAGIHDLVFVGGSTFVVAEVL